MKTRKTSFKVPQNLMDLEKVMLDKMGIPRTTLHRWAIDEFVERKGTVSERLLITKRKDPLYVSKTEMEQVYLDSKREEQLQKIADEVGCSLGIVFLQALLDYCCIHATAILGDMSKYIKE